MIGYKTKTKNRHDTAKLREKLDNVFSLFIRLRDSDDNGFCTCISCGSVHHYKQMDCGHFIPREELGTRYNLENCNSQCINCNRHQSGNITGYKRGIIRKYGISTIGELESLARLIYKMTPADYKYYIDYYRKEIKRLKAQKGID